MGIVSYSFISNYDIKIITLLLVIFNRKENIIGYN